MLRKKNRIVTVATLAVIASSCGLLTRLLDPQTAVWACIPMALLIFSAGFLGYVYAETRQGKRK